MDREIKDAIEEKNKKRKKRNDLKLSVNIST